MPNSNYNPKIHHRKSIRLQNYDYSQNGYYFITICTKDKKCLFGKIENEKMILNELGKIAYKELQKTEEIRKNVKLDKFVIMPNHIHAIIVIDKPVGAYGNTPLQCKTKFKSPSNNLGAIVRGYKSAVTKQINEYRKTPKLPVWQRNYYEHIIRNEKSLNQIQEYIICNPITWKKDSLFVV